MRLESRSATARTSIGQERELSLRARIAQRDESALAELIELTTPWLLGVAQAMLQDADDAEDVVMDTFRVVWTSITPAEDDTQGLM